MSALSKKGWIIPQLPRELHWCRSSHIMKIRWLIYYLYHESKSAMKPVQSSSSRQKKVPREAEARCAAVPGYLRAAGAPRAVAVSWVLALPPAQNCCSGQGAEPCSPGHPSHPPKSSQGLPGQLHPPLSLLIALEVYLPPCLYLGPSVSFYRHGRYNFKPSLLSNFLCLPFNTDLHYLLPRSYLLLFLLQVPLTQCQIFHKLANSSSSRINPWFKSDVHSNVHKWWSVRNKTFQAFPPRLTISIWVLAPVPGKAFAASSQMQMVKDGYNETQHFLLSWKPQKLTSSKQKASSTHHLKQFSLHNGQLISLWFGFQRTAGTLLLSKALQSFPPSDQKQLRMSNAFCSWAVLQPGSSHRQDPPT